MKHLIAACSIYACLVGASQATVVVSQAPTGYFAPNESRTFAAPYYRYRGQDWSWSQNAVADLFSTATLNVSAFDVDFVDGERDRIYAQDSGNWVLLGTLTGANAVYKYTTFSLDPRFFDDIVSGLNVKILIDDLDLGFAVTLGKSVLVLDEGALPPADPGSNVIPEPGSLALIGLGLAAMAFSRKRKA